MPAALAVHTWPGPLPARAGGLLALGFASAPGAPRERVRAQVRLALAQALAHWCRLAPARVALDTAPGRAPRLLLDGAPAGVSFSHEDGLSLAAVNLDGRVGVDLMRVGDWPDWHAVARDYLGPAQADALAACAPARRARAFARAWSAREASLKCHGLALAEWTPLAACRCFELALPAGLSGTLAVPA